MLSPNMLIRNIREREPVWFVDIFYNWNRIDAHNHSNENGVQIPTSGIMPGAITSALLAPGAVTSVALGDINLIGCDSHNLILQTTTSGDIQLNPISRIVRVKGDESNLVGTKYLLFGSEGTPPNDTTEVGFRCLPSGQIQMKEAVDHWIDIPTSFGANDELSNLSSTAVNTNINPAADLLHSLGDGTHRWLNGYFGTVNATTVSATTVGATTVNATTVNATNLNFGTVPATQSMFETGDYKHTSRATLSAGWIWASGRTIGNVGSGATERANADTLALFTHYFDYHTDATLPLYTSAGVPTTRATYANAADAFGGTNLCRIMVPDVRDLTLVGKGDMGGTDKGLLTVAGCGIDGLTLGQVVGAETHALTNAQIAEHWHITNNHTHPLNTSFSGTTGQTGGVPTGGSGTITTDDHGGTPGLQVNFGNPVWQYEGQHVHDGASFSGTISGTSGATQPDTAYNLASINGTAHQNMQPTYICNIMIKL